MTAVENLRDDNTLALASQAFDRPPSPLRRLVVVAATARSGSHLLCRLICAGGLGIPFEYFNPVFVAAFAARWQVARDAPDFPRRYLEAVVRHRTVDGICAVKCLGPQYGAFETGRRDAGLPAPVFVHLWRRDSLAQAISYRLSLHSGYWDHTAVPTTPPQTDLEVGDLEALRKARHMLVLQEMGWRGELIRRGRPAVHIAYEDLIADRATAVRTVRGAVAPERADQPLPDFDEPAQADALRAHQGLTAAERRSLYRAYAQAYGCPVPLAEPELT